jgi:phosphate transport system substrate-binding protein
MRRSATVGVGPACSVFTWTEPHPGEAARCGADRVLSLPGREGKVIVFEWLGQLVDFLGGAGPVLFGILALIAAPFVDKLLVRRKRLSFRVLYNSRIGLGPETLPDVRDSASAGSPQLQRLTRLLGRMSIVVIRIRNSGSYDIGPGDFDEPLSFTFDGRMVWNARVSEASTEELRQQLCESLRFFPAQTPIVESPPVRDNLVTVRQRLTDRMTRWLGTPTGRPPEPDVPEPRWHGVRMDGLTLRRRQRAKLVVVLEEAKDSSDEITKVVHQMGKLKDAGLIEDEGRRRLATLPRVTAALAALLALVLVLGSLAQPEAAEDPTIACSPGSLRIGGSSVFVPVMKQIADEYVNRCDGVPDITTDPNGSIAGVRSLVESADAGASGLMALSDGRNYDHHDELHAERIAIIVYHVVVNSSVGLNTLSTSQLQGIYNGTYTDWSEIRGGERLPIRIIGRGQSSGTRQLFEQNVLGTGEGELSSNECHEKDRNPQAKTIRCERESNDEIIGKLSTTPGAIGYADAPSIADARRTNDLVALTLDGKAFDAATSVESGYPFWTVEYLYLKDKPESDSLTENFVAFASKHELARVRLAENGFRPCATPQGLLELCVR